jgi:Tol biopolymer transport system component
MRVRPLSPSPHRLLPLLAIAVLVILCASSPANAANFGPIELVSKSPREQAEIGAEPVISADGHYLAFCGEIGGREGVFREQLGTGQILPVAVGPITSICGALNGTIPYASAPSISSDGRYVSFTTKGPLLAGEEEASSSDVYVADMSATPPTYELASTLNGSTPMEGSSLAAGRVALSGDGSRVAFVNSGNVYVRDLATAETTLISSVRNPLTDLNESEPVRGGGAYEPAGAAISADGSTVAWVGEHLPEQVPLLGDEEVAIKAVEASGNPGIGSEYHEPLWRRIPSPLDERPATRRIVGGGDPLAPGCGPSGSIMEPQCEGPYPEVAFKRLVQPVYEENGFGWGVSLPQLDGDGEKVALVGDPDEQYDLFVVDMQEGLDRLQAVHQLTRWTNPVPQDPDKLGEIVQGINTPQFLPFTGAVANCAISPDGTRIAFATTRQRFTTPPYTLITELPPAVSRMAELYELNLEGNTIERATPGPGAGVSAARNGSLQGVNSISFGAADRLLAFASDADNLVLGDGNEHSDAFVVESFPPAPTGVSTISPRPPQLVIQPAWRMTANAYSSAGGGIRIVARVPGQGTLRVSARSQLGGRLKSRVVASGRARATEARALIVSLKLGAGRRSLARKPGLVARVHVIFTGRGGQPLHADLQGRFLIHTKRDRTAGRRKGAGH